MKFWKINYFFNEEKTIVLCSPNLYLKKQLLRTIADTHPGWKNIKMKRIKKPANWVLFNDEK